MNSKSTFQPRSGRSGLLVNLLESNSGPSQRGHDSVLAPALARLACEQAGPSPAPGASVRGAEGTLALPEVARAC